MVKSPDGMRSAQESDFDAAVCHQAVISKMKVFLNKIHLGKLTYLGIALSRMIALRPGKMRVRLDDGRMD